MTAPTYYELYYITFVDIKGKTWRVSIQGKKAPTTVVGLTGSDNPFEWDGDGDEDQTSVFHGSSGTIRVIATSATDFAVGKIYPESVMDRRVIVTRDSKIVWQGFIGMDTYSQPYDNMPFEIEIPVISALSAMEHIPLPDYDTLLAENIVDISDMIKFISVYCGCTFSRLYTNRPEYTDYNGKTQTTSGGDTAHWTQGFLLISHYYDDDGTRYVPKTLKEVLEEILYPYGHIYEFGANSDGVCSLGVFYPCASNRLYYMPLTASGGANRFEYGGSWCQSYDISKLLYRDTNTNRSIIAAPASVSFEIQETEGNNTILDMKKEYFKSDATPGGYNWTQVGSSDDEAYSESLVEYFTNDVSEVVETHWFNTIQKIDGAYIWFGRCQDITSKDISEGYSDNSTYADNIPFGFVLHKGNSVKIGPKLGCYTISNYNKIRLEIKAALPWEKKGLDDPEYIVISLYDEATQMHLNFETGGWQTEEYLQKMDGLDNDNLTYYYEFNESRSQYDETAHRLILNIYNTGYYAENKSYIVAATLTYVSVFEKVLSQQVYQKHLFDGITDKAKSQQIGGGGDDISIRFKTMCGDRISRMAKSVDTPSNGFCDTPFLLDTGRREKIEYDEVMLDADTPVEMLRDYLTITDGDTTYLPSSIGMNARNATMKLTLISTNK